MSWLLYGAYGYTGRLILDAALARGLRPIVAGRNAEAVERLADRKGLDHRAFGLDDPEEVARNVRGMDAVLHAAGPYSETFEPMVRACLDEGCHYLDITGEIPILERAFDLDEEARERGVLLIPGVGFDVVPTDCLAARVAAKVDDPVALDLAFASSGGPSRGTARTMVERIGQRGKIRRGGRIVDVRLGSVRRQIPFQNGVRRGMAIPWGDVATAYRTTGIPDIRVFTTVPPGARTFFRAAAPFLRLGFVRRAARALVDGWIVGPDAGELERGGARVWCEVRDAGGGRAREEITTPNPYALTGQSAAAAMERVLEGEVEGSGTRTPAQAFGPGFVFALDGVERV